MTATALWYSTNLRLVQAHLPSCTVRFDREEATWIRVNRFPLPSNFAKPRSTDVLVLLPGITMPITAPPQCFYLDQGLRTRTGATPARVFDTGTYHAWPDLSKKGFATYCLMLQRWNPSWDVRSGDNFLTVFNTIFTTLATL